MTSRSDHLSSPTAEPTPFGVPAALCGRNRLLTGTASQICLVLLATLAATALVPALFGWQSTVVRTGSMEPHIDPGDVVVLADLSRNRCRSAASSRSPVPPRLSPT